MRRIIVAGLAGLFLISAGAADAWGVFDFVQSASVAKKEYRAGSLKSEEALALYSAEQRRNSFAACADQFPDRKPLELTRVPASMKPMALCSNSFAVLYSQTSKTPVVVVEKLSAAQIKDAKDEERSDKFFADPRIPASGRGELRDYLSQKPAVHRGHMAPAADAPDPLAMAQSFALSNMVPQDPKSNMKTWKKVERDTRKFALRASGSVFVYSGPIFDAGHATVGKNRVWKPTRLFKLVYDEATGRAWAYVLPNGDSRVEPPMNYATFVETTGLKLLDGLRVAGP